MKKLWQRIQDEIMIPWQVMLVLIILCFIIGVYLPR
jgi:hypothetical protein